MTYLRESILDLADDLESDNLVSIAEAMNNKSMAKKLREIVEETDRLDDN